MKKNNKTDLYDNVSTNWHTDNVGARLKVYICFEGDGTKPTLFLKPRTINKSITYKMKIYFLEVIRWFGIDNNTPINSQIELRHKESSLIILDTQFLHRGALKKSVSQRSMIALEFLFIPPTGIVFYLSYCFSLICYCCCLTSPWFVNDVSLIVTDC